jgi:hypothetical protein
MIQNRISRGLLPMPSEGTGNFRLFSIIDIAKLLLMGELSKKGIAALPSSILATRFDTYSEHEPFLVVQSAGKTVNSVRKATRDEALAAARRHSPGIVFLIDYGIVLDQIQNRLKDITAAQRRGRPPKDRDRTT